MFRPLPDLPPGVIGFEAVGEVHADDYRDVLRPALDEAAATGGIRLVFVIGSEFGGYSAGVSWEDAKLALHHVSAWERTAIVSDVEWVRHMSGAFGWMVPGQMRAFPLVQREDAVRWVAGEEASSDVPATVVVGAGVDEARSPFGGDPSTAVSTPESEASPIDVGSEPGPEPEPSILVEAERPAATDAPVPAADAPGPTPAEPDTTENPPVVVAPTVAHQTETMTPRAPLTPGAELRGVPVPGSMPVTPSVPAQWAPDPSGRHQHRWWDGERWTEHVADNGNSGVDPLR